MKAICLPIDNIRTGAIEIEPLFQSPNSSIGYCSERNSAHNVEQQWSDSSVTFTSYIDINNTAYPDEKLLHNAKTVPTKVSLSTEISSSITNDGKVIAMYMLI